MTLKEAKGKIKELKEQRAVHSEERTRRKAEFMQQIKEKDVEIKELKDRYENLCEHCDNNLLDCACS